METFEAGVGCCWSGYKFVPGNRAMKCLICGNVMTNEAWQEKRKCFLGHTNAVPAIAINPRSSTNPTRHTSEQFRDEFGLRNTPSVRPRRQLQWRDAPPVRPRQQLQWRDAPPVRPRRQVQGPDSITNKWKYIAISVVVVFIIIFLIIFILKK